MRKFRAEHDWDAAIKQFQKAITLDPKHAKSHYGFGLALFDKKDLEGAIKHFGKAVELDPADVAAHVNLGNALYAKKNLDGAIEHYHIAIKLDPNFARTYGNLGNALAGKNDLDGAIKQYHKGIALDPKDAKAHYNLGLALNEEQDLVGAIKHFCKATELDPQYARAHYALGNALVVKRDLDGAIERFQKAIVLSPNCAEAHCNLGQALRQQGKFAESLKSLQQGHALGSKQLGWPYPSAQWLKTCERLLDLDQKLPAILKGTAKPRDAAEQVELAEMCHLYKKCHTAAAHFYTAAFKAEPQLAGKHRYAAACAAVLAAAGKGTDADKLDVPAKAKLRKQALAWLKADLELWQRQATSKNPTELQTVNKQLSHWQTDPDLVSVRDDKALAQLPEAERKDWQQFWTDVAHLLKKSKK